MFIPFQKHLPQSTYKTICISFPIRFVVGVIFWYYWLGMHSNVYTRSYIRLQQVWPGSKSFRSAFLSPTLIEERSFNTAFISRFFLSFSEAVYHPGTLLLLSRW